MQNSFKGAVCSSVSPPVYSLLAPTGALQGHAVVRVEIGQVMISSETGFYLRC